MRDPPVGHELCSDMGFSKMFRKKTVRLCFLTCQLPCFLDVVVEELVEVGDEIVGRAPLNDVADLIRQVHKLKNGN